VFHGIVTPASAPAADLPGSSTKEELVLAAERLFAVHGIDGVSLRQIGAEAGRANNTVVQYHFGSKDGLVEAILVSRLHDLARRRELLMARARTDILRSVVEAQLLPVIELAEEERCYYLMFLEQLQRHGVGVHPFERLAPRHQSSHRTFMRTMNTLLGTIPPALRESRINHASSICLHACADRQRARHFGSPVAPFALHVSQLLDGVEAFLTAPPSEETLHALRVSRGQAPPVRALP
jgi:AcrR family transcriptional regulator